MTYTSTQFEQVIALFEERRRFEDWLATLEAKRAATPPHIYTRVHADYTARLQRVIEELGTHRSGLQDMERTLLDRVGALDVDEAKRRDEAAEAELRANVGELSGDQHRDIREGAQQAITAAQAERAKLNEELARVRQMLDATRPAGAPAAAQTAAAAPAAKVEPAARPAPAPGRGARSDGKDEWDLAFEDPLVTRAPARPSAPATQPATFDDLEFLKSLRDSQHSGDHPAVTPPAPAPSRSAPSRTASSGASASSAGTAAASAAMDRSPGGGGSATAVSTPTPSVPEIVAVPSAPTTVVPSPTVAAPSVAQTPAPEVAPPPPAPSAPEPSRPAALDSLPLIDPDELSEKAPRERTPAYLRESPPEQVKTLKCQECGTLNYPTEWYCERCGAELAAL
ncbi:MAG TPA: zinc finger Ran-binding domain-containing protein [Gemmatimonadaceae bacterium]|nr:zinc finger Ran-binding domain-containing protein [Gemmatimonadaceae bacterium]